MGEAMDAEQHLPLKHVFFLILMVLIEGERHGYGVVKEIARRTRGRVQLEPGNLYRYVRQLLELQMIEETDRPKDARSDDDRRKYYAATELGKQVFALECRRLEELLGSVDAKGLLRNPDSRI